MCFKTIQSALFSIYSRSIVEIMIDMAMKMCMVTNLQGEARYLIQIIDATCARRLFTEHSKITTIQLTVSYSKDH